MRAEFAFTKLSGRLAADDKWRNTVQRVVTRGTKTEMRAGALGFAMLHVDVVAAAFEMWGGSQSDAALEPALSVARDRFGRYLPPPVPEASYASAELKTHRDPSAVRLLTVHSPYAVPLSLAAQLDQTRSLSNHARNALIALASCDLRLNSGVAGLPSTPSATAQGRSTS
jgi:hypothetical protein